MSWTQFWRKRNQSTPQNGDTNAGDVRDELMFHFRELVNEKVAQGLSFDAAWEQAEKQFGPVRRYETECQAVQVEGRMAWCVACIAIAFLLIACGGWAVQDRRNARLNEDLRMIKDNLQAVEGARSELEQIVAKSNQLALEQIQSTKNMFQESLVNLQNERDAIATKSALSAIDNERTVFEDIAAKSSQAALEQIQTTKELLQEAVANLQQERDAIATKSAQSAVELLQPQLVDLSGQVLDIQKQPLPDTKLLVILKTWPNGQYQQEDFTAISDATGKFILPKVVPTESRFAIQVAAMKDGYAFQSYYHLKRLPVEKPEPITFELKPASKQTFVFRDQAGKPIPNINVIPASRTPQNGGQYLVYFQGADPIQKSSGADGRVLLNYFESGDTAEIFIQWPDDKWTTRKFKATQDEIVIELTPLEATT